MARSATHDATAPRKSSHSSSLKSELVSRFNRIEGQVRGIKRMVEQDTYCDDILNLVASVQAALGGAGSLLLEHHMKSCVADRLKSGDVKAVEELMRTIRKLTR